MTNNKIKTTGFDNAIVGENVVKIEYEGVKTTFTIDVLELTNNEKEDNTIADKELPAAGLPKLFIFTMICGSYIILKLIYIKIKKYNFL